MVETSEIIRSALDADRPLENVSRQLWVKLGIHRDGLGGVRYTLSILPPPWRLRPQVWLMVG